MKDFVELLNGAMDKQGFKIRSLEAEIVKRHGKEAKISKSLIGDYKLGKRAPTYEGCLILADILGMKKKEILIAAYKLKAEIREELEWERFEGFCMEHSIRLRKEETEQ